VRLSARLRSNASYDERRAQRRISIGGHHRLYFAFERDAHIPSRDDIEAVLGPAAPGPAFDALVARQSRVDTERHNGVDELLLEIEAAVAVAPRLSKALLDHLIRRSEALLAGASDAHGEQGDRLLRLSSLARAGIAALNVEERESLLELVTCPGAGLTFRSVILDWELRAHGAFDYAADPRFEKLFSRERAEEAARVIAVELDQAVESQAFWRLPLFRRSLWLWRQIIGREAMMICLLALPNPSSAAMAQALAGRPLAAGASQSPRQSGFDRSKENQAFDVAALFEWLEAKAATDPEITTALEELHAAERRG
jgi:hypothetical protein